MNYNVTFIQYYTYDVEAEDEREAEHEAFKQYELEKRYSGANLFYDDIRVTCEEED